jgi:hypothetical protein
MSTGWRLWFFLKIYLHHICASLGFLSFLKFCKNAIEKLSNR